MQPEPSGAQAPPSQNKTDAELILALSDGQTAALGVLYDRHAGLVYGLAFRSAGNKRGFRDIQR